MATGIPQLLQMKRKTKTITITITKKKIAFINLRKHNLRNIIRQSVDLFVQLKLSGFNGENIKFKTIIAALKLVFVLFIFKMETVRNQNEIII